MILEDRLTEEDMDAVFADLDKSGFFEELEQLDRSFVGLIWFKADYSEIDWHGGEVKFAYADLSDGKTVLPVGCHRDYKGVKYRQLPRGRVEVEGGKIVITTGKMCPKSAIDLIKKLYNLEKHENFIKEKHKSFWDPIGNKPMVGIFWYTDEYDVIYSTVHDKGLFFEDHYTLWNRLKDTGLLKPPYNEGEWDTYPRSRVEFNAYVRDKPYTVYCGKVCNDGECGDKVFVAMVKKIYLLKDEDTKWQYSAHYDRSKDMSLFEIDGTEKEDWD